MCANLTVYKRHNACQCGQWAEFLFCTGTGQLHSLLLPCRLVRENQWLGCWHGIWVWAYELPRWSHHPGCMIREDLSPHVRDQGEPPRWRTSAVVWHGEGWALPCDIAQDTPHVYDNHKSVHTSSVVARNKDCAFHCWPSGRRWKVCDWWTKIATCQKQHHYRHLECVRSLRAAGKVEELTHEMKRYQWNILGLCEVRWKNFGETSTPEGHKLFFSGGEDRHKHGVGFLIHKDTVNAIMGCRPVSSRLTTIRLKASPFNITIIQAYAPTTDYDDDDIEGFYDQLQEVIDQTPKKDILVMQGDWNAKIGEDASKNWRGTCGQYCNPETNERGLRLLEFTSYNNLKVVNTFGPHKPSRRWTWHSPGGDYHNQIDYITVKRRLSVKCEHCKDQELSRSRYWKSPRTCNDDLQAQPPKGEKPGQHKDQVQSGETQGSKHRRNFSSNDRRKVCSTPCSWKSGYRYRWLDQQL